MTPRRGFAVAAGLVSLICCLPLACAGSSTSEGSGGSAGSNAAGAAGVGGACSACGEARSCCSGRCVNTANDPHNCGNCGVKCSEVTYCGGGHCIKPPCEGTTCAQGTTCCGTQCCTSAQLCCDPQGPIDTRPTCLDPSPEGTCPVGCAPLCICASPDTPIATPLGERAIASLQPGDLVYSVDKNTVRLVPIARVHRTLATDHRVVRVVLASGTQLEISAPHPTADGRKFADLRPGGRLDGVAILSTVLIPYRYPYTYDILPASDTGTYFAAGVRIGSTLGGAPGLAYEKSDGSEVPR